MKLILLIISLAYLLLEITFRVRFFEIAGVSTLNVVTFESAEFIGRAISSLGFSILVFSFVINKIKNKAILKSIAISIASLFAFFLFQKYLLDFAVSNLPNDFKKNAFYVEMKKNNFYNANEYLKSKKIGNPIFDKDNNNSIEDKVFYINFPLSYFEQIKKTNPAKNDFYREIDVYVDFLFIKNEDYYYDLISDIEQSFFLIHKEYQKIGYSVENSLRKEDLIDGMIELKKVLRTESLMEYLEYRNVIESVHEKEPLEKSKFSGGRFSSFAKIYYLKYQSGSKYLKSINGHGIPIIKNDKNFFKSTVTGIKEHFHKEAVNLNYSLAFLLLFDKETHTELSNDLDGIINSICKKIESNDAVKMERYRAGNSFMLIRSEKKESFIYLDGVEDENLNCNIDKSLKEMNTFLDNLYKISNSFIYEIENPVKSEYEFTKTSYYQKKLRKNLESKGVYLNKNEIIDIEKGSTLEKIYKKIISHKARLKSNHFLNKLYGKDFFNEKNMSTINHSLSFKEFINHKEIFNHIKSEHPFLVTKNTEHFYYTKYKHSNREKEMEVRKPSFTNLRNTTKSDLKEVYNKTVDNVAYDIKLNDFSRSIIVPIFVMFISTTILVLNFLNVIFIFIKNKKIKLAIKMASFLVIFITPAFISNQYEQENKELYKSIDNKVLTRLMQNLNGVLYKVEKPIADSIYIMDYLEYYYLYSGMSPGENSNHDQRVTDRKSELRKKLKIR